MRQNLHDSSGDLSGLPPSGLDSAVALAPDPQPDVAAAMPPKEPVADAVGEPGPSDTAQSGAAVIVCTRCGRANVPGLDRCANCRSALKGNKLGLRTGLHATNNTPAMRAFEAQGESLFEQSVTDAGGPSELIAREMALHAYRATLHTDILKLTSALETHGQFDRRGRLRERWLARKESLVYAALAIDKTLGLSRRSRHVTPADWLSASADNEVTDADVKR